MEVSANICVIGKTKKTNKINPNAWMNKSEFLYLFIKEYSDPPHGPGSCKNPKFGNPVKLHYLKKVIRKLTNLLT